jgi:serine/threonine protein kinase
MYEMISGRRPLLGDKSGELLVAIARQVPPKLATLVPDIDERLSELIDRALSKDPERRPKTAHEMIEALSPWAFSAVNRAKSRPERNEEPVTAVRGAASKETAGSTASLGVPGGPATLRDATVPIPRPLPQPVVAQAALHSPPPLALSPALSPAPRPAFARPSAAPGGGAGARSPQVIAVVVFVALAIAVILVLVRLKAT